MSITKNHQRPANCSQHTDSNIYVADFETTTEPFYNKYGYTRVWAYCIVDLKSCEVVEIGSDIEDFFKFFKKINKSVTCFFHNLKFDGNFILSYLLNNGYKYDSENHGCNTFSTLIDHTGIFYNICVNFKSYRNKNLRVTFQDSLKKIPLKVNKISKAFNISELKGKIDYDIERPAGYEVTESEKKYITNDCIIVAKALKTQMDKGLTKMTIGSDSLYYFISNMSKAKYKYLFPTFDLEMDQYFRQSYKGGFVYLKPERANHLYKGVSYDVNSLYPSILYGKFGKLPYGMPKYFKGQYKYDKLYPLYIQSIIFMGHLKENKLPTLQLKGFSRFLETEYIKVIDEPTELVLTSPDLELLLDSYEIDYIEYNGGYKFKGSETIFKDFIDFWNSQKVEADRTGNEGQRTLAKLMLNNLYGKFGTNPCKQKKIPYLENEIVKYKLDEEEFTEPLYVALASFVTAYGRKQTIEAGNNCYDRFIYADTDSIHLVYDESTPNIAIDKRELGKWKNEGIFYGKFLHAKTYIKRKKGDTGLLKTEITCASMSDNIKNQIKKMNQQEAFKVFSVGSMFNGNLKQKVVKGGVILLNMPFEIR